MSEKSQTMNQTVTFEGTVLSPVRYFRLPSLCSSSGFLC